MRKVTVKPDSGVSAARSRANIRTGVELVQFVAERAADAALLERLDKLFDVADPAVRLTQVLEVFEGWLKSLGEVA